jgi:hypothetical protein
VAQIFHPSFNTSSRVSIWGSAVIMSVVAGFLGMLWRSPYVTDVGVIREQSIPFSHEPHVAKGAGCTICHGEPARRHVRERTVADGSGISREIAVV